MRFSWKVLVREKNGSITYFVQGKDKTWQLTPHHYLEWRQVSEMSGQPDLIVQLAHYIKKKFAERGIPDVEVRAEARVSLNGRPSTLLLDPNVDLTKPRNFPGHDPMILPMPQSDPL